MALIDVSGKGSIAGPIIVITLSLVVVIIFWAVFGHIGPTYSSNVMTLERAKLRHRFDLTPEPIITNLKILQIPPSERNLPPSVYYGNNK